jgi:phosphoenolpyruvate carboxykinase (ATP)
MWEEQVRERGGVTVASLAEAAGADLGSARFVGVVMREDEILPAVARLQPEQAAALLAISEPEVRGDAANAFLEALRAAQATSYLLKEGRVGGSDPDRSLEVTAAHARAILEGVDSGTIEWEVDPDFGYRVATGVPGIAGRDRFVLIPRFLYARTERVYDYAARVPELKRERSERLEAIEGLDPGILSAVRGATG